MNTIGRRLLAVGGVFALSIGAAVTTATAEETTLTVGEASVATAVSPNKVDVMGIWAHPDDDASFTTPCGVWNDRYDVTCGVIMLTRGEGGSNSVGDEAGPDLGLRRENEDRASHYRSNTLDIYNIDAIDFFYNTSAALTEEVWGSERIQRQVVHVIRQTQPDILTGFSPAPAGHGNHQYAGRVIWEAAAAAADPTMFPEQLSGPDAVDVWQVKMITSGAATQGTGGVAGENCNTGFVPANPFTVVGTWSGYDSPYTWLPGNVQNQPAGDPMTWAQVGREGNRGHPTQARVKETGIVAPACLRYGIAESIVPFQPNGAPANGRDDAILFGSVIADPGGMPLGSTYMIDVEDYFQAPGEPFQVTVTARSGGTTVAPGELTLNAPEGWTVSKVDKNPKKKFGPIRSNADAAMTFTVTPDAATAYGRYRLSATFDNGKVTAYNDARLEVVAGVEGRFERWGNFAEYEQWAEEFTWVSGRSNAERQLGAGESVTVPVVVTNRTADAQSGTVSLTVAPPLAVSGPPAAYSDLAPGAQTTVDVVVTHTDPTHLGGLTVDVPVVTTATPAGITSTENLRFYVVPTTVIPRAGAAPVVDGVADADLYGPALSTARRWEGQACTPNGVDCGDGSTVKLAWHDDDLYAVAYVVDERASAAATPERCFGHWLVDSVEFLLDPMSGSRDTSTTFKSGVFPFTDDPTGSNGNGVDGPCWSRDADNHQGFSTGPLADTVQGAPNSPGQQVAVSAARNADGTFVDGGFTVEVKIPLANLPAAVVSSGAPTGDPSTNVVDPRYLGLNVTPYDSDVLTFMGQTRNAWSPFGSQQSEPYRWGHAYLEGYLAPSGRSETATPAIIPDTALMGVESPQSIYQSAVRGVTIAGLAASRDLTVSSVAIDGDDVRIQVAAAAAGTLRAYAYSGDPAMTPVWVSSCEGDELGFSTCSLPADLGTPPWSPDMGGRLVGSEVAELGTGSSTVTLALGPGQAQRLAVEGSVLISYESADGAVNAWHYPVTVG